MKPIIAPEIFVVGRRFRSKKSFMILDGYFVAGEVFIFEHFGYSHYDGAYVYTFRSEGDGHKAYWWVDDEQRRKESGEPLPDWQEFFEPIIE